MENKGAEKNASISLICFPLHFSPFIYSSQSFLFTIFQNYFSFLWGRPKYFFVRIISLAYNIFRFSCLGWIIWPDIRSNRIKPSRIRIPDVGYQLYIKVISPAYNNIFGGRSPGCIIRPDIRSSTTYRKYYDDEQISSRISWSTFISTAYILVQLSCMINLAGYPVQRC